jgi:hypothetical protein
MYNYVSQVTHFLQIHWQIDVHISYPPPLIQFI